MTSISYIVSRTGTINAVVDGRAYTVPPSHRNYARAKAALKTGDGDQFIQAVDFAEVIHRIVPPTGPQVQVRDGRVYFNGAVLHNVVTERILALAADGWPYTPVANFLTNIEQNPSYRSTQQLYTFLEHRALPLTENGCFLAYKAVRPDWKDKHSGTFDNSVGKVVKVPRNTVDDDFRASCSNGLHVGSIEYVRGFAGNGDHIVVCRVNPKDVVSVPLEENCTKLRCCEYEVIGLYTGDLTNLVYTAQGDAVPPPSRNDPAQGVTLQPPPRDGEKWGEAEFVPIQPGDKVLIGGKIVTAGEVDPSDDEEDEDDSDLEEDEDDSDLEEDEDDSDLEEDEDDSWEGDENEDWDEDEDDDDSDLEEDDDDFESETCKNNDSELKNNTNLTHINIVPLAEATTDAAEAEALVEISNIVRRL